MSSGRKSIKAILCEAGPQNNPDVHDFLIRAHFVNGEARGRAGCPSAVLRLTKFRLPAAKLAALRRAAAGWSAAGALVLVAEDQPALLEVVGRHLDRHPVSRQGFDAVLLHLAGGVGDDFMSGVELHPISRVGKDFGHQSFELDQLFFGHGYLQIDKCLAWPMGAVRSGIRTALAMQESDALHAFRRRARCRAGRFVSAGMRRTTITI